MIFVDSSVPVYLVGGPHPNKNAARELLERAVRSGEPLVTDTAVLEEVLLHFEAGGQKEAMQPAVRLMLDIAEQVYPVDAAAILRASQILANTAVISGRAAIHLAVMEQHRIKTIMSFDEGFDGWRRVTRVSRVPPED